MSALIYGTYGIQIQERSNYRNGFTSLSRGDFAQATAEFTQSLSTLIRCIK